MDAKYKPLKFDKLHRIKTMKFIKSHREPAKKVFVRIFRPYCDLFEFEDEEDRYEAIASMFVTFGTAVLLKDCYGDKNFDINNNLDYTLMYGIVDHYIDNRYISKEEKKSRMDMIKKIIYQGYKPENMTKPIEILYNIYVKHKHRKNVVKYIKLSFEGEYKSYKMQYKSHNEETYKKICGEKGSTMYFLHKAINGLDINEEIDYKIGYIGQMVDDISDIDDDIKKGINTTATYVLEKEGKLDRLFEELLSEVDCLVGKELALYRGVLMMLCYHILNESPYFSDRLKIKARRITLVYPGVRVNKDLGKSLCQMMY